MNLSSITEKRFIQLERIIEKGMTHFVEVGTALRIIKEEKLYKDALGFSTFKEYCKERWGFNRAYAYRLIESAKITAYLSPMGDIQPTSERQIRPLTHLEPKKQVQIWQKAVETAPKGKVTAKHVQKIIEEENDIQNEDERDDIDTQFIEDENTPIIRQLKQIWSETSRHEKTIFIDWLKEQGEF